MNTFLWILQTGLAVVFLGSGIAKSTMSRERLIATGQTGVAMLPMPVVRVTAGSELLAAAVLRVVMVGAAWAHSRLREPQNVAANGVLFAPALAVAVGRAAGF